ncbi:MULTISPECIES: acetylxylan esterase [unclassified Frigoribacterium]|uniref:acetylxylan esterase n=1 Tax=unclassified Frigoribacterium TaxID=2627005 RepID=UPI001566085D|nr:MULTISPECIES: acetylxylan esterase [unclassified Frigoribacterium]NQW85785.1 acetylxylan esterase [Frigoribacterium sp. VKM Ac-2860]NQX07117.1 acetylxylan esterase [Frigoribacterium sp. VKM Ac-2859]WAC53226.1 acetylxylan esterase [Frigoribacterium sp. SL97]
MFTDLPEPALREYRSTQTDPDDFDEFWATTLAETRAHPLDLRVDRVDTGLTTVDVYDVTFAGWAGQPVRAWLRVPAGAEGPLPAVVQFVGYGGGRGAAVENLFWSSAGFAHLQMDTRGQGSGWSLGATPDPDGSGPAHPGVMTRGIDSRETYYYRRVFADAVRAVEAARGLDVVDASRVSVVGGSQGGGIALAVAGLVPDLAAVAAYVPFLCDFRRATVITDADPYKEIGRYLAVHRHRASSVHDVLAYFDGVNFARRATAPALFTTALMDPTCPPSTVFGAFHAYAGAADVTVWPYNGHEGGGFEDDLLALALFRGAGS